MVKRLDREERSLHVLRIRARLQGTDGGVRTKRQIIGQTRVADLKGTVDIKFPVCQIISFTFRLCECKQR